MLASFHGQNKKKTQSSPPMQFISTPNTFNNSLDSGFPIGNKFRYRIDTNPTDLSLSFQVINSTNNITYDWLSLVDESAIHNAVNYNYTLQGLPLSNNTKDTLLGYSQTIRITATNSNGESITQDFSLNFIDYNNDLTQYLETDYNNILLYYAPVSSWRYGPVNNGINPESNLYESFIPDIGPNKIHGVLTRSDGFNMYNSNYMSGTNIHHKNQSIYLAPYKRDYQQGPLRRLKYQDIGNESTFIMYVRYSGGSSNSYVTLFGSDSTNNGFYIGKNNTSQNAIRFQDGNRTTDLSENFYDPPGQHPFDYDFDVIFLTRQKINDTQFENKLYIKGSPNASGPLATKITSGVDDEVLITLIGGDSYLASQGGPTDSFIGHMCQLIILKQCLNSTQVDSYYGNMLNSNNHPDNFIFPRLSN